MTTPAFPVSNPLLPNGQFSQEWRQFLVTVKDRSFTGVTSVSVTPANGISGTVTNPTTTPAITLALGNITPTQVACSGAVTGTNISGTNTGDQTISLSGDASGSGTAGIAVTVSKIGGKTVNLAGNLTTVGAFASTFTMTGVTSVTFPNSGTLATLDGVETFTNKTLSYPKTNVTTVGALTAAATAGVGARAFVTDATATTFLSVVSGGGTNKVPVVSDGTNWLIG